jgi:hypothetical protein
MHLMRLISGTAIVNVGLITSLTPLDLGVLKLMGFIANSKNHGNHHATYD